MREQVAAIMEKGADHTRELHENPSEVPKEIEEVLTSAKPLTVEPLNTLTRIAESMTNVVDWITFVRDAFSWNVMSSGVPSHTVAYVTSMLQAVKSMLGEEPTYILVCGERGVVITLKAQAVGEDVAVSLSVRAQPSTNLCSQIFRALRSLFSHGVSLAPESIPEICGILSHHQVYFGKGARAPQRLEQMLSDPDPHVRLKALLTAYKLYAKKPERFIDIASRMVFDRARCVREHLAHLLYLLVRSGVRGAPERMLALLMRDSDSTVRSVAVVHGVRLAVAGSDYLAGIISQLLRTSNADFVLKCAAVSLSCDDYDKFVRQLVCPELEKLCGDEALRLVSVIDFHKLRAETLLRFAEVMLPHLDDDRLREKYAAVFIRCLRMLMEHLQRYDQFEKSRRVLMSSVDVGLRLLKTADESLRREILALLARALDLLLTRCLNPPLTEDEAILLMRAVRALFEHDGVLPHFTLMLLTLSSTRTETLRRVLRELSGIIASLVATGRFKLATVVLDAIAASNPWLASRIKEMLPTVDVLRESLLSLLKTYKRNLTQQELALIARVLDLCVAEMPRDAREKLFITILKLRLLPLSLIVRFMSRALAGVASLPLLSTTISYVKDHIVSYFQKYFIVEPSELSPVLPSSVVLMPVTLDLGLVNAIILKAGVLSYTRVSPPEETPIRACLTALSLLTEAIGLIFKDSNAPSLAKAVADSCAHIASSLLFSLKVMSQDTRMAVIRLLRSALACTFSLTRDEALRRRLASKLLVLEAVYSGDRSLLLSAITDLVERGDVDVALTLVELLKYERVRDEIMWVSADFLRSPERKRGNILLRLTILPHISDPSLAAVTLKDALMSDDVAAMLLLRMLSNELIRLPSLNLVDALTSDIAIKKLGFNFVRKALERVLLDDVLREMLADDVLHMCELDPERTHEVLIRLVGMVSRQALFRFLQSLRRRKICKRLTKAVMALLRAKR